MYLVGVSSDTDMNTTDIANLTEVSRTAHTICLPVNEDLVHGETYYSVVWAYNGAIEQQKVAAISNGGMLISGFFTYLGYYLKIVTSFLYPRLFFKLL